MAEILVGIVFGLIAWLGKSKVDRIDTDFKEFKEDVESIKNEMTEFKENYLDRFEKVNKNINSSKEQIIEKFHALELSLKK